LLTGPTERFERLAEELSSCEVFVLFAGRRLEEAKAVKQQREMARERGFGMGR